MTKKTTGTTSFVLRPPIVTILGHVDHGKTTLLDNIRKSNVAAKEAGGITQHTAAYQVTIEKHKKITFIDTPGHQAFAKMRGRGANAADIAVLVIAANDGVMPQTVESIDHIKAAGIPSIIALNKIDLPNVSIEKIKKQITKNGISLEEYGGETPLVPISAKTGQGVDKLLEMIILVAELNQIKEDSPGMLKAIVIESELSKNRGPVATLVVRSGDLKIGEEVLCENQNFRVRAIFDWQGKNMEKASPGDPVELLGWKNLPAVGSIVYKSGQTEIAVRKSGVPVLRNVALNTVVENPKPETEKIKLAVKADTTGTLEAILEVLKENNDIDIILSGIGIINESDIFLAKTTGSLVIGFHQKTPDSVLKLAQTEKVIIKTYDIIYQLLEEIDEVVEAIRQGNLVNILGEAKILALFLMKDQLVAGIKVVNGRIARGDQVKIVRNDVEIGRAKIKSLRHGKEDITRTDQGTEAGIILSQKIDLLTSDSIISIG